MRVERDSVSQRMNRIGSSNSAAFQKSVVMVSPVNEGAGCIGEIRLTSSWPHAQLLTGHPQPWVVLLVVLALLPWALPSLQRWRLRSFSSFALGHAGASPCSAQR